MGLTGDPLSALRLSICPFKNLLSYSILMPSTLATSFRLMSHSHGRDDSSELGSSIRLEWNALIKTIGELSEFKSNIAVLIKQALMGDLSLMGIQSWVR